MNWKHAPRSRQSALRRPRSASPRAFNACAAAGADAAVAGLFFFDLLERGVYVARKGFIALSLPIGDAEIDHFVDAVGDFLDGRKDLVAAHP